MALLARRAASPAAGTASLYGRAMSKRELILSDLPICPNNNLTYIFLLYKVTILIFVVLQHTYIDDHVGGARHSMPKR